MFPRICMVVTLTLIVSGQADQLAAKWHPHAVQASAVEPAVRPRPRSIPVTPPSDVWIPSTPSWQQSEAEQSNAADAVESAGFALKNLERLKRIGVPGGQRGVEAAAALKKMQRQMYPFLRSGRDTPARDPDVEALKLRFDTQRRSPKELPELSEIHPGIVSAGPDGTEVRTFPDGSEVRTLPNGMKLHYSPYKTLRRVEQPTQMRDSALSLSDVVDLPLLALIGLLAASGLTSAVLRFGRGGNAGDILVDSLLRIE